MWLFGPLFDQATMHIAQGCGDHLLPSNTPKPMESLHMVHMTLNPFQECLLCSTQKSQKLKDYVWNQLWLRYIVKQIYDKHKIIWWARVNVGEPMIKDDFIKAQNIVYWDRKHKRGNWRLHKNPKFLYNCGYVFTQMMSFISKMQMKWMGFKSPSPLGSKH